VSELAKLHDVTAELPAFDPLVRLANANRRALDLAFGAQRLFLEEIVFVTDEVLDRMRTESHLFAEFISKLAGSHSVKDWGTMSRECNQHQLDFIRRDCDRLFRHGERMIETTSRLINGGASS
jgi:cell wall assembly regulator SMI1